jgi:NitT/TauT family transport system ATP-binding protein
MLEVKHLKFRYPQSSLFHQLSFSLEKGSSLSILGPSGSGKTTLFQLLTGVLSPEEGAISFEGEPLKTHKITYMMQRDLLLPWKTLFENVMLFGQLGEGEVVCPEEAKRLLEKVGLLNACSLYPKQLSKGMKQRASLVRALLRKKPLLFLDEAFSSVDFECKEMLHELVLEEQVKQGFTLLVITHDPEEAYKLGKDVYLLSKGALHKAPSKEEFALFWRHI